MYESTGSEECDANSIDCLSAIQVVLTVEVQWYATVIYESNDKGTRK